MSTGWTPFRVTKSRARLLGLRVLRVPDAIVPEFRVRIRAIRSQPSPKEVLFQGDEDRVSDFLTGWETALAKGWTATVARAVR